ncbi:MAG: hypothetical protein PSV22_19770, partial [Pseudolabrys sp.]|nr:hypothetical protein [Pseudolabrys sp.]
MQRKDGGEAAEPPTLGRRIVILASADLLGLMERRKRDGLPVLHACSALAVLFALLRRADVNGVCWPGLKLLAAEASVPLRTVQKVIVVLEEEGLIDVEARSRSVGFAKSDATNQYTINWERLEELDPGRSRAATAHAEMPVNSEHAPPRRTNTRTDGACSDGSCATTARVVDEHAPPRRMNERHDGACCVETSAATARDPQEHAPPMQRTCAADAAPKEELSSELIPPTPRDDGGGGDEIRKRAEEIVAAYPRSANDLPEADVRAAIEAIRSETGRPEAIGWNEIRDAAAAYARACTRAPLWPRTWLRERGYAPIVATARKRASTSPIAGRIDPILVRQQANEAACNDEYAIVTKALADLTDEQLEELKRRVVANLKNPIEQRACASGNPRKSIGLRYRMAEAVNEPEHWPAPPHGAAIDDDNDAVTLDRVT